MLRGYVSDRLYTHATLLSSLHDMPIEESMFIIAAIIIEGEAFGSLRQGRVHHHRPGRQACLVSALVYIHVHLVIESEGLPVALCGLVRLTESLEHLVHGFKDIGRAQL